MSLQHLLLFLGPAILICLSPGPDILTVITRSISQGTRAGLVATLGFASGLIFHTTLAATGLAILLQQSPVAYRILQWAGAAYLLYLALRTALGRQTLTLPDENPPPQGAAPRKLLRQIYAQSILMNILNPKVTLFFVAFLSGFRDPQGIFPFWLQMIILGALFALCTLVTFGTCALLAGPLARGLRQHPNAGIRLRWITAAVFLAIAVLLIWD